MGALVFLAGFALVIAGFALVGTQVAAMPRSAGVRWLTAVVIVLAWGALQFFCFLGAFVTVYCENCAGRPVRWQDVFASLLLAAPTVVLLVTGWAWRRIARRARQEAA